MAAALSRFSAPLIAAVLCASTVVTVVTEESSPLGSQRQLHTAIIETFGEDVRYFDFPGFLGTEGKANVFLSPLVVSVRNREGISMFREPMEHEAVPLVIANNFILESALETDSMDFLPPADLAALRDNYVQFWGPVWVAGRSVESGVTVTYDNLVPGTFMVAGAPLTIDGELYPTGATITLDRGRHQLEAMEDDARLIWGDGLQAPASPPPPEPHWAAF